MKKIEQNERGIFDSFLGRQLFTAILVTFSIMSCVANACDVREVWLYLGEDETEAGSSTRTRQFICDEYYTPYWFRIMWDAPSSADSFDIKLEDGGSEIFDEDDIAGDVEEWVDEIANTWDLDADIHELTASVRLYDDDYTSPWEESDESRVAIDANTEDDETMWISSYMTGLSCSPGCASDYECASASDDCENEIVIICHKPGAGSCYYQTKYNGTVVGICPWVGGRNGVYYKHTIASKWGKKRFMQTKHGSFNTTPPDPGPDVNGEACNDNYCWRTERYDCIDNSSIGHWWRKTTSTGWWPMLSWDNSQGSECTASSNSHPFHPN